MSSYPATRLRRLRRTGALRALVRETRLDIDDFVMPVFVTEGEGVVRPLAGLAGIAQRSLDELEREVADCVRLGVSALLLFGIPHADAKDDDGSGAYADDGVVQRALRALRPRAVVLAGGGASMEVLGRLVFAARRHAPRVEIVDFRGALPDTGASTVLRLGDGPLAARNALVDRLAGFPVPLRLELDALAPA